MGPVLLRLGNYHVIDKKKQLYVIFIIYVVVVPKSDSDQPLKGQTDENLYF